MAAAGCALAASTALADAPPRIPGAQIAANGPDPNDPNVTVSEPAVACSSDASLAVVVFRVDEPGTQRVGFAIWNSGKWTEEGLIASGPNEPTIVARPTLAYDADNHAAGEEFLAAAVARGAAGERRLVTARFAGGAFDDWESIAVDASSPWDFPRLIAGEWLATGREYYLFWTDDGSFQYRRSTDSGGAWLGGQVEVSGSPVPGYAWASPASADEDVYVAYTHDKGESSGKIELRFLHGADIDDPNDPDDGKVLFTKLIGVSSPPPGGPSGPSGPGSQPPLKLSLKHAQGDAGDWLPGAFSPLTLPTLLADPTDDERLFLVYHDLAAANPAAERGDLNVYMRTITKDGADWQAGERVQVNDNLDDPNDVLDPNDPNGPAHHSDQFLPAATVDTHGNVHVVFYDDRRYRQLDDPNAAPPPRFDVFYAFSDDHGATFTNGRLGKFNDPNQPAVSYAAGRARFGPGDYLSLAANAGQTWAAYGGHAPDDDPNRADAPCVYVAPTPIRLTPTIADVELLESSRGQELWETDIAAGQDNIVVVYHRNESPRRVRRAKRPLSGGTWDIATIPNVGDPALAEDPAVASDLDSGDFMVVSRPGGMEFQYSFYDASDPTPEFSAWQPTNDALGPEVIDKPWVVRGESAEFYLTGFRDFFGPVLYGRTTNGGDAWLFDQAMDEGQTVATGFTAQGAVAGDGALFIVYTDTNTRWQFLEGHDPSDPNDPNDTMDFIHLMRAQNLSNKLNVTAAFSTDFPLARHQRVPYLAADLTNKEDRLYLFYHAPLASGPGDDDVDAWCTRLTRMDNGGWTKRSPTRLHHDTTTLDQVKPAGTVDCFGRVQAIFYDKRNYPTPDPSSDDPDGWDVFYSVSYDYGESFVDYLISGPDPNVPILAPRPGGSGNLVGEYVGIDARMGTVYISLVGTKYDDGDPSDPALDETAIFFTRVTFAE